MLTDDASDFVAMVNGYYRLFVDTNKSLVVDVQPVESNDEGRWRYYIHLFSVFWDIKVFFSPVSVILRNSVIPGCSVSEEENV